MAIDIKVAVQGIQDVKTQLTDLQNEFRRLSSAISSSMQGASSDAARGLSDTSKKLVEQKSAFEQWGAGLLTAGVALSAAITAPLVGMGMSAISMAGRMEQAKIGFATLLGSAEKAGEYLTKLEKFAAATPFEFVELQDAARRMMALGFTAEQALPLLRVVGDTAAAMGKGSEGINRITLALGQMQAKGKISGEEMRQLTEAGIQAWQMLADGVGMSVQEVQREVHKNNIAVGVGMAALIEGMNKKFGGMMANQMGTMTQSYSNFRDIMNFILTDIGADINKTFNISGNMMKFTSWLVELRGLWASLPEPIKGTLIMISGVAAAIGPLALALGGIAKALPLITAGFAMLTGPIGLIAIGIAALITATVYLVIHWEDLSFQAKKAWGMTKIEVLSAIADMMDAIADFENTVKNMWKRIFTFWGDISKDAFKAGVEMGKNLREGFFSSLKDIFGQVTSEQFKAGVAMGQAIREGGEGPAKNAANYLRGIIQEEMGKNIVLKPGIKIDESSTKAFQGKLGEMILQVQRTGGDISVLIKEFVGLGGSIKDTAALTEFLGQRMSQLEIQNLVKGFRDGASAVDNLSDAEKEAIKEQEKLNTRLGEMVQIIQSTDQDLMDLFQTFERGGGDLSDIKSVVSMLTKEWQKHQEWVGENITSSQKYTSTLLDEIEKLGLLKKSLEDQGYVTKDLVENYISTGNVLDDYKNKTKILTDFINNQEKASGLLQTSYGELIRDLAATGINMQELSWKLLLVQTKSSDLIWTNEKLKKVLEEIIETNKKHTEETKIEGQTVVTVTSLMKTAVEGVGEVIKGVWNGTQVTFEDAWKGALNVFVDVLGQMVVLAIEKGTQISIVMATATAGISLVIGLLSSMFSRGKSRVEVVPITTRLKKVFDEFISDFKSSIGDFKEVLFPAGRSAAMNMASVNRILEGLRIGKELRAVRGSMAETQSWPMGPLSGEWKRLVGEFNTILRSFDISVHSGYNIEGINKRIVKLMEFLSDNLDELSGLMVDRFNKIKDIVGDVLDLYQKQKDFTKDMDKTIIEVQRSLLSPTEMLAAQVSDVDALKLAIAKATGDEQIALIGELKEVYLSVWGTAQDLYGGDAEKLVEWQKFTVAGLEAVKESGKTAYDQLIDIQLESLGIQRQGNDIATQMSTYLATLNNNMIFSLQTIMAVAQSGTMSQEQLDLINSTFSQLFEIPHLAQGGVISKPTIALVGESGAEAVVPLGKIGEMRGTQVVVNGPLIMDDITMSKFIRRLQESLKRESLRYV